ncbi:uncharacterized protein MAM_04613 [Metarhizium album ARSEF 1941]|uniref:Uncharacterized protein n=1 Tax=Metarhizium album (strain ARSEF 1941) TaxID=1081103 RepID=A0A0B2WU53_METAS|nr:uncharacterized protein MAM_04613 [Metarhizium album ARSEF 1941]KHN97598.1 hypothetical protein MAM_04613 [Metarhizium album ARSEF 1941]
MRSFLFSSYYPAPPGPPSPLPPHPSKAYPAHEQRALRKPTSYDTLSVEPFALYRSRPTPNYAPSTSEDASDEQEDVAVTVTVQPAASTSPSCSPTGSASSDIHVAMSVRTACNWKASITLPPPSPPGATTGLSRPTTPTSPVQIPKRSHRDARHHVKLETSHRRRHPRNGHTRESMSPSVAALLAVTDIPRPPRRRRGADSPLTVDEIVDDQHVSEKELSLSLSRGPMDLLLSPPEDSMDDDLSATESNMGSLLARTTSADSVPSLVGESLATDTWSSVDSPKSIGIPARRKHSPVRRSLEPIRSPSDDGAEEHPLAVADDLGLQDLEMPVVELSGEGSTSILQPFKPLRSAFKSNLTASLRALRSAAKSFSTINFPSVPPDDFLTRSILTIDPNVPYMDERRPPVTEEMPSAELRRYLNPTTSARIDPPPKTSAGTFSASIQMQTYKVQRSQSAPPSQRAPYSNGNTSRSASTPNQHHPGRPAQQALAVPGMRQREMRENPDFIRIAVMEMAMRRRGKLDDQKPGRARWALPPRKTSMKPYEVGSNGVPARWVPETQSS